MTKPVSRGRLLVVDDEVELMRGCASRLPKKALKPKGCPIRRRPRMSLRNGEFDLLLSDLMMPGTDGIQLLYVQRRKSTRTSSASL